ncbi:MAG: peptide-methionine (S)-S-oxide reductase [Bacteroidetes bacterium]|nr:MAG: peptide-methionine (S)-S-oxide reductase [Bacteroidota bacterium]
MMFKLNLFTLVFVALFISCTSINTNSQTLDNQGNDDKYKGMNSNNKKEIAVFGAGCFWCVEAVFEELKGVHSVESGYTGGTVKNPSYNEICTGETGHAEVAKITYDPDIICYEVLLSVFFKTHDPTTLNSQGADRGTQYRSAIFYTTDTQKKIAQRIINELNVEKVYPNPIVTEVTQLGKYYQAEDYHQNYYKNNPNQGYCTYVIQPKMEKFRKVFKENLKK